MRQTEKGIRIDDEQIHIGTDFFRLNRLLRLGNTGRLETAGQEERFETQEKEMKLIKLTSAESGAEFLINPKFIRNINDSIRRPGTSEIYVIGVDDTGYYPVKETLDEILEMLK